ncbi:MAG: hypothetical protein VB013_15025 [Anaerolineaceae bacterium]|nr:hypothetical protein [Anaerolineaceae bacterium]
MVSSKDYDERDVKAAFSVLLELSHLLGAYREGIVLVGGWVPELLFPGASESHIGSTDVDLALDHDLLQDVGYRSILELLHSRGYYQGDQPFIFYRNMLINGEDVQVEVDFLAAEYGGTSSGHRTQKIQGMRPRKAHGCDLAFDDPIQMNIEGELPEGGRDKNKIQIVSIVPFIIMKAFALRNRYKEKDAYDIYYCFQFFPEGLSGLVTEFQRYLDQGLVREGLDILKEKFSSPNDVGPKFVADFLEMTDSDENERLKRDAFERVNYLISELHI